MGSSRYAHKKHHIGLHVLPQPRSLNTNTITTPSELESKNLKGVYTSREFRGDHIGDYSRGYLGGC